MNERIKQLALDAGIGFTLWDDSGREMIDNYTPEERLEKFAELIVAECVDICNQAILQNQDTLSNLITYDLAEKMVIHGSINQAQKLGKGIKKHFGVEE